MNQPFIKPIAILVNLGGDAIGGYCDPLTGECYPASEMDASVFQKENPMTTAIDSVCKMEVEIETAQFKSEYQGQTYYFCAPGCQRAFEKEPQKYLTADSHEHHEHL